MSTRHTKIRRDLRRNWGRAVLAVLSITIGVLAVGINSGMMDLMPARMLDSYQATNPAHVRIWLDGAVDDDQLARLAREPGLLGVEGQADLGGQWRLKSSQDWRDLSITLRSDYEQQQFNTLVLLSGAWPHKKTVAIEEASLAGFDIPADGAITMRVNGRDFNLKIGGVVRDIMGNPPAFGGNWMPF